MRSMYHNVLYDHDAWATPGIQCAPRNLHHQHRTALSWLNLDRPTPAQIGRLSTYESAGPQFRSVDFRAPLDPIVNDATYLLIYAAGILPLQPVQLKGSVYFSFDTSMTAVERRVDSGVIVGRPSRPVTTAAFAIIGRPFDVEDVHPGAKLGKRKQAGAAVYELTDGGRTIMWTTSSKVQPDVASALSFRLTGQDFLPVKWNSDFCASEYTLFSAGAALKPIAGNGYGCDP